MSYPKIMCDNIPIAEICNESDFCYNKGVNPYAKIPGLENSMFSWQEFFNWVKGRIVPDGRVGIEKLLSEMSIQEYRVMSIAERTKACLMEDPYWIAFSEEDENNWRTNTLRGAAGFPLVQYKELYLS